MASINPAGLTLGGIHSVPPPDQGTPHLSSLTDHTGSVGPNDSTPARKRGRPSTRGESGMTPPPEIGWWEDRAPSWHKDSLNGSKSSMDLLIEWSEEMKNQGHYYWMGVREGGNLHQGAARFRDYLYVQRGPIRRSTKAIRNKVENIKQKFFEAQDWLKDPEGGHGSMPIPEVERKLNKMCRNYRFWETIFVENGSVSEPQSQNQTTPTIASGSDQTLHSATQQQQQQLQPAQPQQQPQPQAPPQSQSQPQPQHTPGQPRPSSGPLIRGIPVSEDAAEVEIRNIRRRLNDGTSSHVDQNSPLARVAPLGHLERDREDRDRERHDLAKKQQQLNREQFTFEKKREEREQKRLEWDQTRHIVEAALKIRELDLIPLEDALVKAKALYALARSEGNVAGPALQ